MNIFETKKQLKSARKLIKLYANGNLPGDTSEVEVTTSIHLSAIKRKNSSWHEVKSIANKSGRKAREWLEANK